MGNLQVEKRIYGLVNLQIKTNYYDLLQSIVLCVPVFFCEEAIVQVKSGSSGSRLKFSC